MKKTILILAATVLAAGCHDSSSKLSRDQQNYGVVQEGATGAATSTLNAPGEAPPPMTATNVDTTSNLTLLPGTATAPGQPGTIAGTMTGSQAGSMNVGYANDGSVATPRARVPRPAAPRVVTNETTTHTEAPTVDTIGAQAAPMTSATQSAPPARSASQTSTSSAPAPSTDTATTAPTETGEQKTKDKPKDSRPSDTPPPSTDTSTTTAPPPTST